MTEKRIRLDKWLWAARFYKTRSIAREMVQGGKVHYNGQRGKASRIMELGALLTIRQGDLVKQVKVEILADQRQGAPIAETLYKETVESLKKREQYQILRKLSLQNAPHPERKPNKKQRRELIQAKIQRNTATYD
ncbi:ribosome-associated heat shock protein Hsp15 [Psychromonas antarctica]|uniref:ribosome-associated heat shock protein Hsp15 n=1 Tax=Psychromonas antarctica TaxID=67573 RepID=UPI001EE78E9D|nr:ribosome-associated heat shock protein Hsp15 [Psychromonas antarctica]MCG6200104.1 ribosome-associated heat shock protein Hsp15 [Psychromonas antarctica]